MNESGRKAPAFGPYGPPEPRKPLSAVQERIARLLGSGSVIKQVAATLQLSETTVKYHIREIAAIVSLPDSEALSERDQVVIWAYWTYREQKAG